MDRGNGDKLTAPGVNEGEGLVYFVRSGSGKQDGLRIYVSRWHKSMLSPSGSSTDNWKDAHPCAGHEPLDSAMAHAGMPSLSPEAAVPFQHVSRVHFRGQGHEVNRWEMDQMGMMVEGVTTHVVAPRKVNHSELQSFAEELYRGFWHKSWMPHGWSHWKLSVSNTLDSELTFRM